MLEDIKKIQGINHNEFDNIITTQINAAKLDLISIGIVDTKVNTPDDLIKSIIYNYVLSFLDVNRSEMYMNAYILQKDYIRRLEEYTTQTIEDGILGDNIPINE